MRKMFERAASIHAYVRSSLLLSPDEPGISVFVVLLPKSQKNEYKI